MMLEELGTDIALDLTVGDVSVAASGDTGQVSGLPCLEQDLWIRLQTPRGSLDGNENYGVDVTDYLQSEMTSSLLTGISQDIVEQCESDIRVEKGSVEVIVLNWELETIRLKVTGKVAGTDQQFSLVIGYGGESASREVLYGVTD